MINNNNFYAEYLTIQAVVEYVQNVSELYKIWVIISYQQIISGICTFVVRPLLREPRP